MDYETMQQALIRKDNYIKKLQDELRFAKRERDAAIADLTEFAKFYRRNTICHFCEFDGEEECSQRDTKNNHFINDCFKWRGYNGD